MSLKKATLHKKLNCIDIDDIGNLETLPRLVFINEECGNLIVVNDGGKCTDNISQKKPDVIVRQYSINVHSVTNVVCESISSVTYGILIVKQLGNHNFSCDLCTTE